MDLFVDIDPSKLVQQGDLVRWRNKGLWQQWGIVVTADCHIQNPKHWGRLSVVPVESPGNVATTLFSLQFLEKQRQFLLSALRRELGASDGSVSEGFAETLIDAGTTGNPGNSDELLNLLRSVRSAESSVDYLALAIRARELANGMADLNKFLKGKFSSLPDDLMFVPTHAELGGGKGIAWLRFMRELSLEDLVNAKRDWHANKAIRVGRVGPVLRYRLTQRLAQLFSEIGTPDIFKAECVAQAEIEIDQLCKGK